MLSRLCLGFPEDIFPSGVSPQKLCVHLSFTSRDTAILSHFIPLILTALTQSYALCNDLLYKQ